MTREEEIKQMSESIALEDWHKGQNGYFDAKECLTKGAEWADQHPREGLWDAEKVKQFLRDNTMFGNHPVVFKKFIKSLTQYMEE